MSLLSMHDVRKTFGEIVAVDDLSFEVRPGEIFGFLGGNGAGKTTSMRMILDIIRPTSGRIEVLGGKPGPEQGNRIGFLPEERGLYPKMTAIETIIFFGRMKGMTTGDAKREGMALLERFELADRAKSAIADMSKGMAQKVQLATSIVNSPELLILDEPFSGLDPVNQQLLEDEIVRAQKNGAAVMFSTHVMQHVERLCDRMLVLKKGKKRFEGTPDEARELLATKVHVTAKIDPSSLGGVASAERVGSGADGWTDWQLALDPDIKAANLLEQLTASGTPLRRFDVHRADLHDVFVHLVGEEEAAR
ncbi:ABC transporter ATP-binding protein [Sphingomicrobium sediminis]|uniref:ATP-binding cassette domain-containing protein n=1 Tax=Sphingomicrobium sediminis TaxID=2950949 RepID=A0A9X2J4M9_9SPHN|nr:ATP-binding cassette domain-containing protein [Sphingomicrobium sediminis]MCM8557382.1 ATP-binding cassette domain-containing protein [Sphingomicrobium sediminis]